MPILLQPCESFSLFSSSSALDCFSVARNTIQMKAVPAARCPVPRAPNFNSIYTISSLKTFTIFDNFPVWRTTQIGFCSGNDIVNSFSDTYSPGNVENDGIHGNEDLELLEKPDPVPATNGLAPEVAKSEKTDNDEVLAPFLKYFKPRHTLEELEENEGELGDSDGRSNVENKDEEAKKLDVEYYEPKPGDIVVGVVVSGNENKLDVNVGSDLLGTMLTKEVLPLYDKEMEYLLCDFKKDAEEFMVRGKMGIVKEEDEMRRGQGPGRPVVDIGAVLFAEVLGRTLSGRPLLSTRRLFRRISWHRVRQIKQLNEPIQVKITEWNTGGLLTRIEGLRAFLPKAELVNRVNSFTELKENVGRQLYVQITRINEANNDLILSEKKAWEMLNLQEGTLLEGTVKKIFPYGAQVRIGETNRSGLLHISNISRTRIASVSNILKVDEKVKVLVVKSMFPDKISLSIADLESEPGLFMSNKEKVFSAAEEMAKKYRQKLPTVLTSGKSEPPLTSDLAFDDEASVCANWSWFKFETDNQSS